MGFAIRRSRDLGTTSPLPTGVVSPFAGTTAPTGWLLCAGQEVEIASYGDLYGVLGTTYGALTNGSGGAGSTHFRVPDLRGRMPAGKDDMGGVAANRITNAVSGITATTLGASGGSQNVHQHQHGNTVTNNAVTSGNDNTEHTHAVSATTGTESVDHTHGFGLPRTPAGNTNAGAIFTMQDPAQTIQLYSGNTGGRSAAHTHSFSTTSGGRSAFHQHSVTSNVTISNVDFGTGTSQNIPPTLILNYIIKA